MDVSTLGQIPRQVLDSRGHLHQLASLLPAGQADYSPYRGLRFASFGMLMFPHFAE